MRAHRLVAAALALAFASGPADAGFIDTRPSAAGPLGGVEPLTLGSTFLSDNVNLSTFSFILSAPGGSTVAAQVYATAGGVPTGAPLWTSGLTVLTGVMTEYTFAPDLAITPGVRYWIGTTGIAGHVAGTSGNHITWVRVDDPLPTEQIYFTNLAGTPTTPFLATVDPGMLIVMNPEPGTFALFGLGALGLCFAVRRRRARAATR